MWKLVYKSTDGRHSGLMINLTAREAEEAALHLLMQGFNVLTSVDADVKIIDADYTLVGVS